MSKNSVAETSIGPPRDLHADFFLPPRPATSLNAAQIRIVGASSTSGTGDRDTRVQRLLESLRD